MYSESDVCKKSSCLWQENIACPNLFKICLLPSAQWILQVKWKGNLWCNVLSKYMQWHNTNLLPNSTNTILETYSTEPHIHVSLDANNEDQCQQAKEKRLTKWGLRHRRVRVREERGGKKWPVPISLGQVTIWNFVHPLWLNSSYRLYMNRSLKINFRKPVSNKFKPVLNIFKTKEYI